MIYDFLFHFGYNLCFIFVYDYQISKNKNDKNLNAGYLQNSNNLFFFAIQNLVFSVNLELTIYILFSTILLWKFRITLKTLEEGKISIY